VRTLPALQVQCRARHGPLDPHLLDVRDHVAGGCVVKDLFLITGSLGVCLGLAVLAIVLIDRAKNRRPYLAARWDDGADDWADETPDATSPADLDALELLWDLPAYGTGDHTTTHHEGEL
jgi:hypothetical protein